MNDAKLYVKSNILQKRDAAFVLENYFRLIQFKKDGGDTVLDVGCGSGDVTVEILKPYLPENFGKLVGSDFDEKMVDYANGHYKTKKTEFITLDIASKEPPVDLEENFDHIFSFYCLHWVQDQHQALTNIYDLLKPGGDILLTFLASNPIYDIYEALQRNNKWAKYMATLQEHVAPYQNSENPEREYDDLLKKVGFSVKLCKVVEKNFVYPSLPALKKAVLAVNPFMKNIPESDRDDYLEDYVDECRKMNLIERNHNNNEEKVNCPYKLFIVFASKPSEGKK